MRTASCCFSLPKVAHARERLYPYSGGYLYLLSSIFRMITQLPARNPWLQIFCDYVSRAPCQSLGSNVRAESGAVPKGLRPSGMGIRVNSAPILPTYDDKLVCQMMASLACRANF